MIALLKDTPSKILNRIFLIAGFVLFCPLYTLNLFLVNQTIGAETLTTFLTSFDTHTFKEIVLAVSQNGQLDTLFLVYVVNIITIIGFMFAFFSLTLIIARSLNSDSKIYRVAFIFPILTIIISIFDILPSIVFLLVFKNTHLISDFTTYFTNGSYVFRVILLYGVFLWVIMMGIYFLIRKIRGKG